MQKKRRVLQADDEEYVGLCTEFPNLSWLAETQKPKFCKAGKPKNHLTQKPKNSKA
jgi:hypothetical protein